MARWNGTRAGRIAIVSRPTVTYIWVSPLILTNSYVMPAHVLKTLATRHFSQSAQIQTILQTRAPSIVTKAEEILALIQRARAEYQDTARQAEVTATPSTEGSTAAVSARQPATSTATTSTPLDTEDVWHDLSVPPAAKQGAKSGLFGSTIRSSATRTAQPAGPSTSKGKTSGLFGKTIKTTGRAGSSNGASFNQVRDGIFADLAPITMSASSSTDLPSAPPADIDATAAPAAPPATAKPKPFAQTPIEVDDSPADGSAPSSAIAVDDGPSPPKRSKRDEIVQVKKRSKKPRKIINDTESAQASSNGEPSVAANGQSSSAKDTKKAAAKKRHAATDIPEFDYSKAPNLLDNPRSGIKDAGKKKRKEKKERKGQSLPSHTTVCVAVTRRRPLTYVTEVLGADFGPAPKEKSNMRSGNKSGTF